MRSSKAFALGDWISIRDGVTTDGAGSSLDDLPADINACWRAADKAFHSASVMGMYEGLAMRKPLFIFLILGALLLGG
jgi:hypothetical protein